VLGETWGWPMLVIDAGTALTLTGADADHCLGGSNYPELAYSSSLWLNEQAAYRL